MDQFEMGANQEVNLDLEISTEAIIGSHVKLEKKIIKKSAASSFNVVLGNSGDIENKKLNVVVNCFVEDNIEEIMNNIVIDFTISDDDTSQSYQGKKLKIDDAFFIVFFVVELIKK